MGEVLLETTTQERSRSVGCVGGTCVSGTLRNLAYSTKSVTSKTFQSQIYKDNEKDNDIVYSNSQWICKRLLHKRSYKCTKHDESFSEGGEGKYCS